MNDNKQPVRDFIDAPFSRGELGALFRTAFPDWRGERVGFGFLAAGMPRSGGDHRLDGRFSLEKCPGGR